MPRTAQSMQQAAGLIAGGKGRHVARDRSGDQRDERQGTRGGPESGSEDGGSCGSDDGAASAEDSQVLGADGAGTRQLAATTLDKRMEKSGGGRGAVGRVSTCYQQRYWLAQTLLFAVLVPLVLGTKLTIQWAVGKGVSVRWR